MELNTLTLTEAIQGLSEKKFSSVELTKACLRRTEKVEPKINAFVTLCKIEALERAKKADTMLSNGSDLPLLGIPIAVKDNFSTLGVKTTASSNVLKDYIPPFESTVTRKLWEAGAILLGKTNMDAWAHGSSTETSDFGPTKNPWDSGKLPGGSSGGSAASVASDETIAAIGSETAGSIRQPSSWCGVIGTKPTYGRVSRYGVIAMASSLDSPGPITKTVEDSAKLLQVIAGHDRFDATSSKKHVPDYLKALKQPFSNLVIGVSDEYLEGVDTEVIQTVKEAIKEYKKLGAVVKKIMLFKPKYAMAVYTIIQRSEVSSNLARYDGIRYGLGREYFGEEAKRRIMLGTYTLSSGYYDQYYKKASKVRTFIIEDFQKAFEQVDVLIHPTSPSTALPLGSSKNHPMFGEVADVLVEPSSIAGLPGINVLCGFSKNGLPIGMQIIGPQFSEELLFKVAYFYEQKTNWRERKPAL